FDPPWTPTPGLRTGRPDPTRWNGREPAPEAGTGPPHPCALRLRRLEAVLEQRVVDAQVDRARVVAGRIGQVRARRQGRRRRIEELVVVVRRVRRRTHFARHVSNDTQSYALRRQPD